MDNMDRQEMESEMERLHGASFGWALCCCGWNKDDAEDVLQTVYLKVLDGRATFRGESALKTWLFALIRRTASEQRRRDFLRLLKLNQLQKDASMMQVIDQASPIRDELISLLKSLPSRQREVLQL